MGTSETTIIAGIEIPSVSPVFLTVAGVHVLLGIACVITGFMAMLSEKRRGRHPQFGTIYYWCLSAVFATATFLSVTRWPEDYHLFVLGALSFTAAFVGRMVRRRGSIRLHITGMGLSYIVLLTAFYVDNGHSLPLWKELSPIAYWIVPGAIGIPIIIWALVRHPVVRHPAHRRLEVT
jgi:asparagine N-glycosylation enzyme membrane subunit Stt3